MSIWGSGDVSVWRSWASQTPTIGVQLILAHPFSSLRSLERLTIRADLSRLVNKLLEVGAV